MGEGSCAQADGLDVLRYRVIFQQLAGNTISNKKGIAKENCLRLCSKHRWCYAIQLSFQSSKPDCSLVTDRPTFEKAYGKNQNYSNQLKKTIDGIEYTIFCGDGCSTGDDKGFNWGGGKLSPLYDVFCYKKLGFEIGTFYKSTY